MNILPNLCRICLKSNAVRNIFSANKCRQGIREKYFEMMNGLFTFNAYEGDGFPNMLCQKCAAKLTSAFKLQSLAESSHKKLSEIISTAVSDDGGLKSVIKNENDLKMEAECGQIYFNNILADTVKKEDENEFIYSMEEDNLHSCNDMSLSQINTKRKTKLSVKKFKKEKRQTNIKERTVAKRNIPSICDVCGKLVVDIYGHKLTHRAEKKKFPCDYCSKVFLSCSARRSHRNIHHLGMNYYCDICKKSVKHYREHIRIKHSGKPTPFECAYCGKKFQTRSKLIYHMGNHTKERPYPCSVCGKGFRTKTFADYHRRDIHEKEKVHICHYCSKGFFYLALLKEHLRKHTNEGTFTCKECDKSFINSARLKRHQIVHGNKEVVCEICEKKFYSISGLKTHMITHTKERKHSCKYCGVKFGRTDHRNRHERTAHGNKIKSEKSDEQVDLCPNKT